MYDDVWEGALKTRSRFDGWMGASESRYCLRSDRLSAYEQWSLPYDQALRNELEALHGVLRVSRSPTTAGNTSSSPAADFLLRTAAGVVVRPPAAAGQKPPHAAVEPRADPRDVGIGGRRQAVEAWPGPTR